MIILYFFASAPEIPAIYCNLQQLSPEAFKDVLGDSIYYSSTWELSYRHKKEIVIISEVSVDPSLNNLWEEEFGVRSTAPNVNPLSRMKKE